MFKVLKTGKHKNKSWKRMVNKATFVGENFTRKPVKMEVSDRLPLYIQTLTVFQRFIRPMGLVSTPEDDDHSAYCPYSV